MDASEAENSPKPGTLAWVGTHDLVEHLGAMLPTCHRVPEGASLAPADASTHCRVVNASGDRCQGTRTLAYGVCMGHLGAGGTVDGAMGRKGAAKQAELKLTRQLLGIGPVRSANPRAVARIRAAQRANELALALVDGPLDDRKLSSVERQAAALRAVDATFPIQSASLEISGDPEAMDWSALQEFASSLLG